MLSFASGHHNSSCMRDHLRSLFASSVEQATCMTQADSGLARQASILVGLLMLCPARDLYAVLKAGYWS